jgi:aerobic carbon-monoxide dehydrogenase medium subunit
VKPSPLGYARPQTVTEALAMLAEFGPDGKVLAGGQSLVPLLSMRLAAPAHLVDINRLTDLAYVTVADGTVRVGALARHAELLASAEAEVAQPLLAKALRFVAHPAIRNRGTTVGSIVHADPAGEMPAILALLGGTVQVASTSGTREIPASEFFVGVLESAVEPEELATQVQFPALRSGAGTGFAEISRRRGDYAVCGVGTLVELADDGTIASARAAYLSVAATPLVLDLTEAVAGVSADATAMPAVPGLVREHIDPIGDLHATAEYRAHLAGVLTERAMLEATREASSRAARNGYRPRHGAAEPGEGAAEPGERRDA